MSHSTVCASCARRLLLRARRLRQPQGLRSASTSTSSFVPLNQHHSRRDSPTSHNDKSASTTASNAPPRRSHITRDEPLPAATTPEDDFLHRLFRGLVTSDPPDLYSRPRVRQSAEDREAERQAKAALFRPPLKRRNPKLYSTPRVAAPAEHPAFVSNAGEEAPPIGYHEVSGRETARGADRRRGYRLLKSQVGLPGVDGEMKGETALDFFEGERGAAAKGASSAGRSSLKPEALVRSGFSSFEPGDSARWKPKTAGPVPEDERELDDLTGEQVASQWQNMRTRNPGPSDTARERRSSTRPDIAGQWQEWEKAIHMTGVRMDQSFSRQKAQRQDQTGQLGNLQRRKRQEVAQRKNEPLQQLKRLYGRSHRPKAPLSNHAHRPDNQGSKSSKVSGAVSPTPQESSSLAWTKAVRDQTRSTHELWEAFKKEMTAKNSGQRLWRLPEYAEMKIMQRVATSFCEGRDEIAVKPSAAMNELPIIREYKHARRALWTTLSFAMRSKSKFPQQLSIPIESLLHEAMALWQILLDLRGTCVVGEEIIHPVPDWTTFQQSTLLESILSGDLGDIPLDFRDRFNKCLQLEPTSQGPKDDLDTAALVTAALLRAQMEADSDFTGSGYQDFLKFVVDLMSHSNVIDALPRHVAILDTKLPSPNHRDATIADLLKLLGAPSTPGAISDVKGKAKAEAKVSSRSSKHNTQPTRMSAIPMLDALDAEDAYSGIYPDGESKGRENPTPGNEVSEAGPAPSNDQPNEAIESTKTTNSAILADSDNFEKTFCRRLGRVIEDKDLRKAERRWQQAAIFFGEEVPLEVCRLILTAFMACRAPKRAVEVWNDMMAKGITPNAGMWNAMLKGCSIMRDVQGLEEMWQRMLNSGVKLEAEVWGTRIHGLARTRQLQKALQTFQQMTRDWVSAAQKRNISDLSSAGNFEEATKPTVECLNPLVKVLVREGRYKDMVEAFELSRRIGVKPDAYTFNGLFKAAMSVNNTELANRLLGMMKSLGIDPDIATFTMLLDAVFQQPLQSTGYDDLLELTPPSETEMSSPFGKIHPKRREAIQNIFKEMEASGHPPNERTFSHLVLGLLRSGSKTNIEATYAIIDHMAQSGIFVESSIFTNLITHHLSVESPPDLEAAETVWSMALQRTYRQSTLDNIFWDRLIEGFSRAGGIRQAMEGIRQCRGQGRVPGWMAMTATVKALVSMGDTISAEDLIVEVSGEERMSRNSGMDKLRVNRGKDEFWQTVREAGLMPVAQLGATGRADVEAHEAGVAIRSIA